MKGIKYEEKYLIIKWDDLHHLSSAEQDELKRMMLKIGDLRHQAGKSKENKYYVVNHDEPYADMIWGLIKFGETLKEALKV